MYSTREMFIYKAVSSFNRNSAYKDEQCSSPLKYTLIVRVKNNITMDSDFIRTAMNAAGPYAGGCVGYLCTHTPTPHRINSKPFFVFIFSKTGEFLPFREKNSNFYYLKHSDFF